MAEVTTFPLFTTPLATALQTINFLLYRTTSASSLAIGTGTKTFTVEAGKDFQPGAFVIAASDAAPTTNYMAGSVISYSGTSLAVNVTIVSGSGTYADWSIQLSGPPGATGSTGAAGATAWLPPVAWQTLTAYTVGPPASVVVQGGETYVALISHTSGTFATDLAASRWIKVAAKGADGAGTGDMLKSDNLSGLANYTTARSNMGLAIGTNVQAQDATLQAIAALGTAADRMIYTTGVDTWAELAVTSVGRGLLDDTTTAAQLTTLTARGQGTETISVPGAAIWARTTAGPGAASRELTTGDDIMIKGLAFDTTTEEAAQFYLRMPKSWNLGTVTAQVYWTNASGLTTETVTWGISAVALHDSDPMDTTSLGTEVTVTDTWLAQNDLHISSATSAITFANTPAVGDLCIVQIARKTATDNMTGDADLLDLVLFFTTNAATDA